MADLLPVADVQFQVEMLADERDQAEAQVHELLGTFMKRLAQASKVSGSFHAHLVACAREIGEAKDLREVTDLLRELLAATHTMAKDSLMVHDELVDMRQKVLTTDQQIGRLHAELDRLSVLARHDPLTGALNRKGMDEALHREISKLRRANTPLSVAMLDIDNFKNLNDTLGHAVGDAALRHLAVVARDALRPQDTMARYGGEEFIVLLPDTTLEQGIDAIARLQKVLAQKPFMNAKDEVRITFSAGVAQVMANEDANSAVKRADEAMYQAKRVGKNRVVGNW